MTRRSIIDEFKMTTRSEVSLLEKPAHAAVEGEFVKAMPQSQREQFAVSNRDYNRGLFAVNHNRMEKPIV